ncbi:MAG: hypothetical protein ABSF08_06315 [Candidatus Cybelea sp.]
MNPFEPARKVADAVLYEGYILYPYTASAPKNRIRWQFGVVVPAAYAAQGTGEPSQAQTEVLLECDGSTEVDVLVRFLQVEARQVEAWTQSAFVVVDSLVLASKKYVTFDEGVERELTIHFRPGAEVRTAVPIASPAQESVETLTGEDGAVAGRVVRRRWPLHGAISLESEPIADRAGLRRLRVRIENSSAVVRGERSSALRTAFVSTHTLFHARGGRFLSALDPPDEAREATARLVNRHTWPVLVGDEQSDSQRSRLVLSSPIILYDFPAVAPQSEADTFDATEVDELMMLSVRSLSDQERDEARATDERARAIIERAERFGPEELARLHGTLLQTKSEAAASDPFGALDIPGMDCIFVDGTKVSKGSRVRLHPKRRADVWDLFLDGRLATVRAIHQDVENLMYVAVSVDDDPASELHDWYGRSLFFYPDEVEPVGAMAAG